MIFSALLAPPPQRPTKYFDRGFDLSMGFPEPVNKHGHLPYRIYYPNGARTHVEHMVVSRQALDCFNQAVADFVPQANPLTEDQVASAARWAKGGEIEYQLAQTFIQNRCQWYPMLKWISEHPEWGAAQDCMEGAERLVFYFEREPQILPDDLPRFGLMDNAMMMNEVQSFFKGVLTDFQDYDRYCSSLGRGWGDVDPEIWLSNRVGQVRAAHGDVKHYTPNGFAETPFAWVGG